LEDLFHSVAREHKGAPSVPELAPA